MSQNSDDKEIVIHVDFMEQDPAIPKIGEFSHCERQDCPGRTGDFVAGYGLAGGGIGVYLSCDTCYKIVAKDQDFE